jgi:hypothetical protein
MQVAEAAARAVGPGSIDLHHLAATPHSIIASVYNL